VRRDVDFFAVVLRRAGDFRAVVLRPVVLRADDFFAVVLRRPVLLRAGDFRAVVFLAVRRFLVAAAFFPAADRFADVRFLVVAAFFAAVDRLRVGDFRADDFLAVVFLRAAGLRADDALRAAVFLAAAIAAPFPVPAVGPRPSAVSSRDVLSGRHALQASPFPFAHAAPDAVALVAAERVVEAFDANGTLVTDPLGLPR
jgi:hypothetical protein